MCKGHMAKVECRCERMNGRVMVIPAEQAAEMRSQLAALCWRMHRGRVEVLLITSRDTGRWIIPKGWPMEGFTQSEAAAREAWEEAGVEGRVTTEPLGFYTYDKVLKNGSIALVVAVYPLRVARLADRFPERKQRRRKWFPAGKAARKVAEPELRRLLASVGEDPGLLVSQAGGQEHA